MEDLELTSPEDLVRRYAPELIPDAFDTRYALRTVAMLGSMATSVIPIAALQLTGSIMLFVMGGFLIAGAGLGDLAARRFHARELDHFYRNLRASPWRLYEAVAAKFAREIERQRARTIGPHSDWGRARAPLEAAAQETARSVAYWEERCAMDRENEIAREQLETALRLRGKFQDALVQLDARAHVLVSFFNQCEARLAVLQYARRDYEEVKKLGALSERADDIVADAESTLAAIGRSFLSDAIRVGNALGGLERVGWLSQAANVPVDRIEMLADRILESSVHERDMLDRLTKEVIEGHSSAP